MNSIDEYESALKKQGAVEALTKLKTALTDYHPKYGTYVCKETGAQTVGLAAAGVAVAVKAIDQRLSELTEGGAL